MAERNTALELVEDEEDQTPARRMSPKPTSVEMDWAEACRQMLESRKVQRLAWKDASCIYLLYGLLKIRKADATVHDLIVSEGDMLATDWVVVREH